MKTYNIEVQKVKAMANSNGLIRAHIDASVLPSTQSDDGVPATVLSMSEPTARVLMLLLKVQLAEFDGRKAKSRR